MPTFITESRPEQWNTKGLFLKEHKAKSSKTQIMSFYSFSIMHLIQLKRKVSDKPAYKEIYQAGENKNLTFLHTPA